MRPSSTAPRNPRAALRAALRALSRSKIFALPLALSLALPLAALGGCSEDECPAVGARCVKSCAEGFVAQCVVANLCECVPGGGGGGASGDMEPPLSGGTGPQSCLPPAPGALALNELLADPAGDEGAEEFFELVNLSEEAVDLAGLRVVYNGSDKVRFSSGCMAPKSAAALFGDEGAWRWSSPPGALAYEKLAYRFSNSADFTLELVDARGGVLSALAGERSLIQTGVSANRAPDLRGEGVARHDALSGAPMSPGLCANGARLEDDCVGGDGGAQAGAQAGAAGGATPAECDPPALGDLTLNELMANPSGAEPNEEFVELVNTAPRAVSLAGVSLTYNGAQKVAFS
ncbi:MAG: lamin tail domain-containing protein, partial [Deltaproteobacteria bacterium]|nr:lamin tail domain-containing protein [Deltaproteobacteria bacterium]